MVLGLGLLINIIMVVFVFVYPCKVHHTIHKISLLLLLLLPKRCKPSVATGIVLITRPHSRSISKRERNNNGYDGVDSGYDEDYRVMIVLTNW